MGIRDWFPRKSIDEYVAEAASKGAVLVDVRERAEFAEGHIDGAINIPLGEISEVAYIIANPGKLIYAYCRTGRRSKKAAGELKTLGYENVVNIGGTMFYKGKLVQ